MTLKYKDKKIGVVILAAGEGKRMKSSLPKLLHKICGKPLLSYVLELVRSLKLNTRIVVVGHKKPLILPYIGEDFLVIEQKKPLGTADALKRALPLIKKFHLEHILLLYGDQPLLKTRTIRKFINYHLKEQASLTVMTTTLSDPSGYGRIIRDNKGRISFICEEKSSPSVKHIKEINVGVYCFRKDTLFKYLSKIPKDPKGKEYYLTEIVKILNVYKEKISEYSLESAEEAQGVNTRQDLCYVDSIMRKRILNNFINKGITILDPSNTFIYNEVSIGKDTLIYPYTVIEEKVKIGKNCQIGPFCHLRAGTVIGDNSIVGNFLELARSKLGKGVRAKHFGYLGDARIKNNVNIGAGTVTANFDGKKKYRTYIAEGAFIGSDTILVAPVKIGKRATTGAGCVIPKGKDVAEGKVVVGVPARILR